MIISFNHSGLLVRVDCSSCSRRGLVHAICTVVCILLFRRQLQQEGSGTCYCSFQIHGSSYNWLIVPAGYPNSVYIVFSRRQLQQEGSGTHDNNVCAQKLNRNRIFFNPRYLLHIVLLKNMSQETT